MKSEKKIFERYEKDANQYVIQISTNNFRDLFHKFDKTSSFIKRDLDLDFAEYLFDSATDLKGRSFYISLSLQSEKKSVEFEDKVNKGIDSYFEYESNKIVKQKKKVVKRIFLHIILAISCFFISYSLSNIIDTESFLHVLFVESIIIAAWVLMWPVFSDFIYELLEAQETIKTYKKLIDADLKFSYLEY